MATVINFPLERTKNPSPSPIRSVMSETQAMPCVPPRRTLLRRSLNLIHAVLWVLVALLWPLWRLVAIVDLSFQFVRMLYYWHTPGTHAAAIFLLHCVGVIGLALFFLNKPRGL